MAAQFLSASAPVANSGTRASSSPTRPAIHRDVYNLKLAENNFFFVSHDVPEGAPQAVHDATKSYGGYVGMGYDFAWIVTSLAQQLKQEGKEISGRNLITKLREIRTVKTPVNEYRFLPDGNTVRPLALFSVAGGGRKLEQSLTPSQLQ